MIVRFWEARVEPDRLDDAHAWVRDTLLARAAAQDGFVSGEVFLADGVVADPVAGDQPPRIVLLTRWLARPEAIDESLPPDGSIARAHGWYFRTED
jgi:hypothetical protein